jgi:hypothetical protein
MTSVVRPLAEASICRHRPLRPYRRISAVRPTNKTNMAAKSEAEKAREQLRTIDREIDPEGNDGAEFEATLIRARDGGLLSRSAGSTVN